MELIKVLLAFVIVLCVATVFAIIGGKMADRIYNSDEI